MEFLWLCSDGTCYKGVVRVAVGAVVGPRELDILPVVSLGDNEVQLMPQLRSWVAPGGLQVWADVKQGVRDA